MEKIAAVSCSPLAEAGLGFWLTGKLGPAWDGAWYGAWVDDVVKIHSMACVSGGITFETAKMTYSCIVK